MLPSASIQRRDLSCNTNSVAEWLEAALSLAAVAMEHGRLALASCVSFWRGRISAENAPPAEEARLYHRFLASNMPQKNKLRGRLTRRRDSALRQQLRRDRRRFAHQRDG